MRRAILLFMLYAAMFSVMGQTSSKNDELKLDADYYLMLKEYGKALDIYLKIIRSEPENADIKHRIGICYLNSENDKARAIPYLEEAVRKVSVKYNPNSFKEESASFEACFALGSAYRVNNELDKAIEAYMKFREYLDLKDEYNLRIADQYIRNCRLASEMHQHPVSVSMINLGNTINNERPNFNAVVSGDGKSLAFTSPGRQGYEIFMSAYTDTGWVAPRNMTSALGTGKFMKTCDLSYDGLTLLLSLEDPENSDIYVSYFRKGRWSKVEPLGKAINSKSHETHASLSADNKILYFTSNRKGGEGDLDIYTSESDSKGEWGKAVNLGPRVNTPFNEETPFITSDGNSLYFSSEGHEGMGGYDIYRYDYTNADAGAVNLGYPVNTTDNNLFYYPAEDGKSAFYAMAGPGSFGGRDVYRVMIEEEKVVEVADAAEEEAVADVVEVAENSQVMAVADSVLAATNEEEEQVTEVTAAAEVEPIEEIQPEPEQPEVPEVATDIVPVASPASAAADISTGSSFTVQIMALRKPVDLSFFKGLTGITVTYSGDRWYRYTLGVTTMEQEARRLLEEAVNKGYTDAFIRRKGLIPHFTIQVMAVPGPVVDLTSFSNLPEVAVLKGADSFCRYFTGEFETKEAAGKKLTEIQRLGYSSAFIRRTGSF